MKLRVIAISILLNIASTSLANTKIRMPDPAALTTCLSDYEHFLVKTNLVNDLANKELEIPDIIYLLDTAIHDYAITMEGNLGLVQLVNRSKLLILKTLLKKYSSEGLRELSQFVEIRRS